MAIARVSRLNEYRTASGGGSISVTASTAFTPSANSLLVVVIGALNYAGDIATSSFVVSGGGLTWTQVIRRGDGPVSYYTMALEIWVAQVGASPASTTLVATNTATNGDDPCRVVLQAFDYTGLASTSVAVQSKGADITGVGAQSYTLDAAPASANIVVAARNIAATDGTDASATPGSGWTEIYEGPATSGYSSVESQERTGSTSTTVAWADIASPDIDLGMGVMLAVELAAASGASAASATGSATVGAVGGALASGSPSATGSATVAAVGGIPSEESVASASGSADVVAVGGALVRGVVASAGAATVAAIGNAYGLGISAQTLAWVVWGTGLDTVTTSPIDTHGGSLILVGSIVWQWDTSSRDRSDPFDSKSNTYTLIGDVFRSDTWPTGAGGVWANRGGSRGTNHTFTKDFEFNSETDVSVVEISNAGTISGYTIGHIAAPGSVNPDLVLPSTTATGPGWLLVYCGCDWFTTAASVASGWTLIHEYRATEVSIHLAVFAKRVEAAGSYPCTVEITGQDQGATTIQFFVADPGGVGASSGSASVLTVGGALAAGSASASGSSSVVDTAGALVSASGATTGSATVAAVGGAASSSAGSGSSTGSATVEASGGAAAVGSGAASGGGVAVSTAGAAAVGSASSTGSATVSASGGELSESGGSAEAAGSGTATATGGAVSGGSPEAQGAATAQAVAGAAAVGSASSTGSATVSASGGELSESGGSAAAAGSGTATATGGAVSGGSPEVQGAATAQAVAGAQAVASGAATGAATADASGGELSGSVGVASSSGSAAVAATGGAGAVGGAAASGSAAVASVGQATAGGTSSSAGSATVDASGGSSLPNSSGAASSSGSADAAAIGGATSGGSGASSGASVVASTSTNLPRNIGTVGKMSVYHSSAIQCILQDLQGYYSSGTVLATGAGGSVEAGATGIPIVNGCEREDLAFKAEKNPATTDGSWPVTSTASAVLVTTLQGGSWTSIEAGTSIVWSTPSVGVDGTGIVGVDGIVGGTSIVSLGALRNVRDFRDIGGHPQAQEFFRARMGDFPAVCIQWRSTSPADGSTGSTWGGSSRTRIARGVKLYVDHFDLSIVTTRLDSNNQRMREGALLRDAMLELLTDRMVWRDLEVSKPHGIQVLEAKQTLTTPTSYIDVIRIALQYALHRSPGPARSAPWERTRYVVERPNSLDGLDHTLDFTEPQPPHTMDD